MAGRGFTVNDLLGRFVPILLPVVAMALLVLYSVVMRWLHYQQQRELAPETCSSGGSHWWRGSYRYPSSVNWACRGGVRGSRSEPSRCIRERYRGGNHRVLQHVHLVHVVDPTAHHKPSESTVTAAQPDASSRRHGLDFNAISKHQQTARGISYCAMAITVVCADSHPR